MKKNKKLIISLGAAAMTVAPVAAVVSCGSKSALNQGRRTFVEYTTESSFTGERNRA